MYLRLIQILFFLEILIYCIIWDTLQAPTQEELHFRSFLLWRFCWICYHSLYSMPTASISNFLKFELILLFLAHTGGFVMLPFVILWNYCFMLYWHFASRKKQMITCDFGVRGSNPKEINVKNESRHTRNLITLMQFPKNETEKVSGRKCQK